MKPIPINAAKNIAKKYGYDQVVVYARKTGDDPEPHGEHVTTYGVNKEHCSVAGVLGHHVKRWAGWANVRPTNDEIENAIGEWDAELREEMRSRASLRVVGNKIRDLLNGFARP